MAVRGATASKYLRDLQNLEHGSIIEKCIVLGMNLILGLIAASAVIFQSCSPFGIGMVAQAGAGLPGLFCMIGAGIGYLLVLGLSHGIKYIATTMIVFTIAFVFKEIRLSRTSWFMPLMASMGAMLTGFLNVAGSMTAAAVTYAATETVLVGASTVFFRIALSEKERMTEQAEILHTVSVMVLLGCFLIALSNLTLFGVLSLGRIAAVLLVMIVAYRNGFMAGSTAGAALGMAMDMVTVGSPFYTMSYAFSGLLAGIFTKQDKLLFIIGYVLSNAVSVIWTWGSGGLRMSALFEVFVASVIFAMLPVLVINRVGEFLLQPAEGSSESGMRRYAAQKAAHMGQSFRSLYDMVSETMDAEENDGDVAKVFDRAADAVCIACKRKEVCWQQNFSDMLSLLNDATPAMLDRGKLIEEDLPRHFTRECLHLSEFLSAVNGEVRGLLYRRQFHKRLSENRVAAYGQYADLAEIMEGLAEELNGTSGADPLAERRLLRCLRSMDIEAKVSVFRDRGDRLRVMVESGRLGLLFREERWLDKVSAVLGVRMCRPNVADVQEEGRLLLLEAEPLSASVGIASKRKQGQAVSGDCGTYFKTDRGVLCVILSDGMGSGEEAAKESGDVVKLLEGFLRSGMDPCIAMKILNSVMLLRSGDDWGCATVDLMCVDLFSGETSFYKYGAAPSYVRNGKMIRRIECRNFAAGISMGEGAMPDVVRMKLKPGNLAVIASDGVLTSENDAKIEELLSAYEGNNVKKLATMVLQSAIDTPECEDDMTVLAVQVSVRA